MYCKKHAKNEKDVKKRKKNNFARLLTSVPIFRHPKILQNVIQECLKLIQE